MELGGQPSVLNGIYSGPNAGSVGIILPSVYTVATLPPATCYPTGTFAYCSDSGWVYSNGYTWIVFGAGGSIAPYGNSVSGAPAAAVSNYAPPTAVAGVTNRYELTPFAGGTTVTSLSSAGIPDGFAILHINDSNVDSIIYVAGSNLQLPGGYNYQLLPETGKVFVLTNGFWRPV